MPGKLVLYSAIFGGKDAYREPPDGDYDVVLFTDHPPGKTRRTKVVVVPLEGNPRRLARKFKTTPHLLFPDADYTLWMDGLIEVRDIDPRKACLEHLAEADVAAHYNKESSCIYDAANICIRKKVDLPEVIRQQVARYRAEGYPENNGLVESGIVILKLDSADKRGIIPGDGPPCRVPTSRHFVPAPRSRRPPNDPEPPE